PRSSARWRRNAATAAPRRSGALLLTEGADLLHERLDVVGGELVLERGHLPAALRDGVLEASVVPRPLPLSGPVFTRSLLLTLRRLALAVVAVADGAVRLVVLGVPRLGGRGEREREAHDERGGGEEPGTKRHQRPPVNESLREDRSRESAIPPVRDRREG